MHRPSRYAAGLLALLVVAQTASALTLASWAGKELGPAFGREDYQSLAYELGAPSGPDTSASVSAPGFGRDLHYFVVVGPPNWPDGTVVHNTGDAAYNQSGWQAWGGTCFVGMDSALIAGGFPVPVCVGSDGNLWGFWGANGQFQITINDPQLHVRPAIASRGDWSFDTFYVHSGTSELWHTGWSPAAGWIDEPVSVAGTQIYGNPWVGGVDAAWAGFGATAPWANKIVVSYVDLNGQPAVLTGSFASSGHAASNNINWTSNAVVSTNHPTRFPSIAFVGTPSGTRPTIFYDDGPDVCLHQQANTLSFFGTSFTFWSAPATIAPAGISYNGGVGGPYYCGDVAARAAPNGSLGSKVNLWQPQNFQIWGYSR
jgi:hypothetical protein